MRQLSKNQIKNEKKKKKKRRKKKHKIYIFERKY